MTRTKFIALLLAVASASHVYALDAEERSFFGLTALEATHPHLTGEGYSVGVSDTEFDVTHPGLGWTGADEYDLWFNNRQYIPNLNRINPRIYMAGHRMMTSLGSDTRHGGYINAFDLPITYNNTLMTNWWSYHGTLVSGTLACGLPGPGGNSLGAVPKARLIFAGDTEKFEYLLSMVPEGNPTRTVSMNRSFTGSAYVQSDVRRNAGVIGVNAAGNSFDSVSPNRTAVFGTSPHLASIRWLERVGYDLIVSGLRLESATQAYAAAYGSMRNQESIFTDYSVRTISPDNHFDGYASGTSLASPFLAGGIALVQQAYELTHPGRWLRVDQMARIVKKSGKFIDDGYTGLRLPVANFAAAVALAETYASDPGLEPNFTSSFAREPRVEATSAINTNYYLNPLYFRTCSSYGTNAFYEYTAPTVDGTYMRVAGNQGGGNVNVALRNGWGDLAVVDLTESAKKLVLSFNYDTSAGSAGGQYTEVYVGIKEMLGSAQFMDDTRENDNIDRGRLAFRISYTNNNTQARVDLLQCSEAPVIDPWGSTPVWQRSYYYVAPAWDASPLATAFVTNLHNGSLPRFEASFTGTRAVLKINNQTIIDAAHTAPQIGLTRSTPYLHFRNAGSDCVQRLSAFTVATTSISQPYVVLENIRQRAYEGVDGVTAHGLLKVRRTSVSASPLTVYYAVSGSAVNGQDYQMLPGSITIPANEASAEIAVRPITDSIVELANEEAIVTLTPNGSYAVSSYSETGRVVIVDATDSDSDGIPNSAEDVNGNGNLTDDDANANMLPNYLDALDGVPTNNVAPIASAGADVSTSGTEPVSLSGSASHDPDGSIAGYAWSIIPNAANGPVTIEGANTASPQVRWTASTTTNRSASIRLTVTDNYGATGSDTVTVTQLASPIYNKVYQQVYFRGSPNGWDNTPMYLVNHYTWETEIDIIAGEQNYKFDVYGNWTLNFGDNNNDGIADQGGANISFTQGAGRYRVRFNDQTRAYSAAKIVANQPPVANAGDDKTTYQMTPVTLDGSASYDPDGSIVSYAWSIIEGQSGPVVITNTNSAVAILQWHEPATTSRTVRVQLTVTDDHGRSASDVITVVQTTNLVFNKNYPQVYFRGTANNWGTTAMTLISNNTWYTEQTFANGTGDRFKFDVHGDWSLSFGDNNFDGYADQSGADINIHLGAGTYRIWFNDQTRQFAFNKVIVNQPPVANAGQDQEVGLAGATITLNGSASYDADGSISEYSWYQSSGPIAIITYSHPGNPNAAAVILSRTNEATYVFSLRVTDNSGAMSTDTVTVVQRAAGFNKTYPQVYFRGTANGWGTTLMTLVSNYVWETEATFGSGSGERFKLDVHGNWLLNYGDNNNDGVAEQSGADIAIKNGAGTYRIRFNDQSKAYTVTKIGGTFVKDYNTVGVAGTFNGWNPSAANLTLIGDNTWSGTFTLSGNVEFKITANGSWGVNWGDNDQPGTSAPLNGYLNGNGGNIRFNNLASATYRITMHERTLAYSVTMVAGTEAGEGRILLGWEARYGLDLFGAGATNGDPDSDTLTNLDEYHLGTNPFSPDTDSDGVVDPDEIVAATDPLDSDSFLHVTPVFLDGALVISWSSHPSRVYRVEGSPVLGENESWEPLTGWMSKSDGGTLASPAVDGILYYRVRVGAPDVINALSR